MSNLCVHSKAYKRHGTAIAVVRRVDDALHVESEGPVRGKVYGSVFASARASSSASSPLGTNTIRVVALKSIKPA